MTEQQESKAKTKSRKPRKTPEERLAELNEQQAKIERELKQRKERILRQKRQQQTKLTNQKRKEDTRRKVLDGALLQHLSDTNKIKKETLDKFRDSFLERDDDRALFGLPPRTDTPNANKQAAREPVTPSNEQQP